MIWLNKVDGSPLLVNENQIVLVELAHDAIVVFSNGEKLRVQESAEEIAQRIADWQRRVAGVSWLAASGGEDG